MVAAWPVPLASLEVPAWAWLSTLALGVLVSLAVLWQLARPRGQWGAVLRRRLVLGVPWGTLLAVVWLFVVYLFLQGAGSDLRRPVVIPFRAWSYFYPLGVLAAGFSHAGLNHLLGNVTATLLFGSLAEYAWGHFPTERGSSSFSSLRTNPFARILAFFGVVLAAGVAAAAFSLGPVIGFSGVVFALAGFALVRYPIPTVVMLLAGDVLSLVLRALRNPITTSMAEPRFGTPWWANIAIQGHALGLFLGLVAGVVLFRRRRESAGRPAVLWLAALVFAVDKALWAVYTFLGNNTFRLFRATGVGLAFVLAAMVAAGLTASEREFLPSIELRYHEVAVGLLLATLVALGAVAVPFNLTTVGDPGAGVTANNSVEVRDYTVFYEEDVPNQLVSAVDLPGLDRAGFNDSGVIVVSERRNMWWEVYGKRELAFAGDRYVRLGGVGWRRTVRANRTGWSASGGPATYRIRLKRTGADEPWTLAHVAPPARAAPRIEGKNVSVAATRTGFDVLVARNNTTLDRTPIPPINESVRLAGIDLARENRTLVASTANGTRVTVAKKEQYQRQ